MSLIPSENAHLFVRQQIRSEKNLPRWRYTAPHNNPYDSQTKRKCMDPVTQQLLPYAGQVVDGRLYQSRDALHWRQYMGLPVAESEFHRAGVLQEAIYAAEFGGQQNQVARFWQNRADNWHC